MTTGTMSRPAPVADPGLQGAESAWSISSPSDWPPDTTCPKLSDVLEQTLSCDHVGILECQPTHRDAGNLVLPELSMYPSLDL